MNTHFTYLYRDGANYKYTESVVVLGTVTFRDIKSYLNDGGFCPEDVGLPHPGKQQATGWPNHEVDHPWCEIHKDSFEETSEEPTEGWTAAGLVAKFAEAHGKGWPAQHEEQS